MMFDCDDIPIHLQEREQLSTYIQQIRKYLCTLTIATETLFIYPKVNSATESGVLLVYGCSYARFKQNSFGAGRTYPLSSIDKDKLNVYLGCFQLFHMYKWAETRRHMSCLEVQGCLKAPLANHYDLPVYIHRITFKTKQSST